MRQRFVFFFLMAFCLFSCKKASEECFLDEDILAQEIEIKIERLENSFFNAETEAEVKQLLEKFPEFAERVLILESYESSEELALEILAANQDSLMLELYEEVRINFEDISDLEKDIENAFKYIKYYFPEFQVPKVYTFVSGFSADIYIDADILVIGLDYFLPFEHRFQPPDLPQYISKRYQREYIVPTIVTAISSVFNKTDMKESTLLAEMIYYGKAYHFTKSILPCTSDKYIIGYSEEEIAACFANEEFIWAHFVEGDLLFETNPFVIRKYTGEAPSTDEISPDAPGRIGRWLGWNIVDDYRFNNKFSLPEMMMETDTDKIFRQSGYKPRPL
ncbi:GldB [Indibacter alkaliphilus LW1]|uniref:GldB n=1 Tax=Indibacter alkaliphilus (strain CCUG 57479 / KCTC 22604 / LW1) TaxID=1189612 RepID=S2CXY4_INDAL|nr:gliding motility lipoprotein GldB [Indibacter alkaliphilus]EOZ92027.1 GldB [Indibacter alkaliphilus LW1]